MIYGTGIDVVEIDRIEKELARYGDRFCETLFTKDEIAYCKRGSNRKAQSQCFAGRFAAKEAFFKAIGTGLRNGLQWKDIEILNDTLGKPKILLREKAQELVKKEKISNIQLSISHNHSCAVAAVILE